ncbi:MAG: 2-succinyl-5-enolpyruvyl-6-hydroxy-3-cyclohexene-1-carboxylic-acid synthase [Sandaracinaceae bacterium]|nr:2-succinyl-5-enolpyruvyl-6-hydroxy-3-cyclohexene-1-carboxylic-acid synthase [Sandaracinaceae bacterium]
MTSTHEDATRPTSTTLAPSPDTVQTEWCRVLAETLRHAGITHVIASPGSRSTPILAGMLLAGLAVKDVVDERAAAFVALGYARSLGRPAAVLCTSGTAPAHWYPAVLEASLVEAPMVLVSADRPAELSHCGAPQTLDQTKLFGEHVRFFADPGHPEADERALVGLRRVVGQAVSASLGPRPGPVHLNVRARKPLEPVEPRTAAERALHTRVNAILARPLPQTRASIVTDGEALDAIARTISESERILLVAGPLSPRLDVEGVRALVARSGGVLVAESTSQLRFTDVEPRCDSLDVWLAAGLFSSEPPGRGPDLVLELGGVPTSGAYERWVARTHPRRVVLGVPRHVDPHGSAEHVVLGDPGTIAGQLAARIARGTDAGRSFREELARLERAASQHLDELARAWGEPAIARIVASAIPADSRLVIGNSSPIRMLDRYATRVVRTARLEVLHQRGANGIDGLVAQSAGAVLGDGRTTVALLGDVTLLHDVGALVFARHVASPLVIVVVDNAGGRIFEALPVAREAPWMMAHMTTSEEIDHASLARAFGVAYERVQSGEALREALDRGIVREGVSLVHACVDPLGARVLEAELVRRIARALEAHRRAP